MENVGIFNLLIGGFSNEQEKVYQINGFHFNFSIILQPTSIEGN